MPDYLQSLQKLEKAYAKPAARPTDSAKEVAGGNDKVGEKDGDADDDTAVEKGKKQSDGQGQKR